MNDRAQKILAYSIIALTFLGLTSFVLVKTRKKKVRIKNKNPKKILIVGDSQSAIKNDSGSAIKFTYPNILIKDFPDKQFDVLASVGKQTKWMLDNLPAKPVFSLMSVLNWDSIANWFDICCTVSPIPAKRVFAESPSFDMVSNTLETLYVSLSLTLP